MVVLIHKIWQSLMILNANQSDFIIAGSIDNFTVSGSDIGSDTLIDIEFLKFNDGLVTVDNSLFGWRI